MLSEITAATNPTLRWYTGLIPITNAGRIHAAILDKTPKQPSQPPNLVLKFHTLTTRAMALCNVSVFCPFSCDYAKHTRKAGA